MSTTAQLIAEAREILTDKVAPYKWSDALLVSRLAEAELEACRRARLIEDRDNEDVCELTCQPGGNVLTIDPRVIFIRRVTYRSNETGERTILKKVMPRDLDTIDPGWEESTATTYTPRWWTLWDANNIRIETANEGGVNLWVVREPLFPCALEVVGIDPDPGTPAVDPEIPARYHSRLVDWICYRSLYDLDEEQRDDARADKHLAMFEAEFGKRSSSVDETWINRKHGFDEDEGLY